MDAISPIPIIIKAHIVSWTPLRKQPNVLLLVQLGGATENHSLTLLLQSYTLTSDYYLTKATFRLSQQFQISFHVACSGLWKTFDYDCWCHESPITSLFLDKCNTEWGKTVRCERVPGVLGASVYDCASSSVTQPA